MKTAVKNRPRGSGGVVPSGAKGATEAPLSGNENTCSPIQAPLILASIMATETQNSGLNSALVFIRLAGSLPFLYHGSAILFGAFGGPGPRAFAEFMHAPAIIGYLIGLAQFCGGLAILLGLFSRIGGACIFVVMAGAVLMVHLPKGYDISKGGMEFALSELFIAIAIVILGPGKYALGARLPHPLQKL